jgi:hypothetical protein
VTAAGSANADTMFQLYIHVLSIANDKGAAGKNSAADKTTTAAAGNNLGIEFSRSDFSMIQDIYSFESQGRNSPIVA